VEGSHPFESGREVDMNLNISHRVGYRGEVNGRAPVIAPRPERHRPDRDSGQQGRSGAL
jgi:hypothetical protein